MCVRVNNDISNFLDKLLGEDAIVEALRKLAPEELAGVSSLANSHATCATDQAGSIGTAIAACVRSEGEILVSDLGFAIKHLSDHASLMQWIASTADAIRIKGAGA